MANLGTRLHSPICSFGQIPTYRALSECLCAGAVVSVVRCLCMHKEKKETITYIIALSNNDLLMGKDVVYGLEHIKVMSLLGPRKKGRGTKKS